MKNWCGFVWSGCLVRLGLHVLHILMKAYFPYWSVHSYIWYCPSKYGYFKWIVHWGVVKKWITTTTRFAAQGFETSNPAGHFHMRSTWSFSMQNACLSHGNAMWKRNPSCGHHVGCVGEQHEFLAIHMNLGFWVGYAWGMLGHGLLWKSCWCHVQRRKKGGGATPIFPMGISCCKMVIHMTKPSMGISCCKMVIHMTKPGTPKKPAWGFHVVKWLSTWQNQERHKNSMGISCCKMVIHMTKPGTPQKQHGDFML